MLDVIFLLLCFFVTVSVFSQWESEITIKLPSASTAEEPDRLPGEIIVNLAKDGKVSVNGVTLDLADLKTRLARVAKFYPDQAVIIRADKAVRYELLVAASSYLPPLKRRSAIAIRSDGRTVIAKTKKVPIIPNP